ncbi:X-box-binding protein 1, partial [Pseudolycoriella hygida]
ICNVIKVFSIIMSAPILITIPKYLTVPKQNLLPLPSVESSIDEFMLRGKKRRLDHLTWEEKFQRKKLKNRVAAQTSRDRKKAKMDDMERTIKEITDENKSLKETCNLLQSEKDELTARNEELERQMEELKQRLNERSAGCDTTSNGSAESKPLLKELDSQSILRTINKSDNSNASDMLEEFDASRLEELAESLLADVITDLADDSAGDSETDAETNCPTERVSRPVVGTRSELMEPSQNIDDSLNTPTKKRVHIKIEPKMNDDVCMDVSKDDDSLYGTYDENTHCITILVSGDDIATDEAVEEVYCDDDGVSEVSMLSPVSSHCSSTGHSSSQLLSDAILDVKSPISQSSDCGYESIGSPLSY